MSDTSQQHDSRVKGATKEGAEASGSAPLRKPDENNSDSKKQD
jgi:hypothetical protein